eukprot:scaffold19918_cov38-Attheya_sp.AAC.1
MDVKRPLLTQVPSQTDVQIKVSLIRLPCKMVQGKLVFELNSMDLKRALLTQVPSQTDVRIKS